MAMRRAFSGLKARVTARSGLFPWFLFRHTVLHWGGVLDTSYTGNLKDLFGGWSLLAMTVGFVGALLSYLFSKRGKSSSADLDQNRDTVIAALPWVMLLLAIFIGVFVLAASMAYSGPLPGEYRMIWRYDKYFATLTALTFALVFVFNALQIPKLRRRPSAWVCLAFSVSGFWLFLLSSGVRLPIGIR